MFSNGVEYSEQLNRIERKLDIIIAHLNIGTENDMLASIVSPKVIQLIDEGKLMDAISVYRDETGADVRTANSYIHEIAASRR